MADATPARYRAAHLRVRDLHGPACTHPCATSCGRQAAEWAYDGADPAARLGLTTRRWPAWYSDDPAHYRALCKSCHWLQDHPPAPVAPPPPAPAPVQLPSLHPARSLVDLRKPPEWTGVRLTCSGCGFVKDAGAFTKDRSKSNGRKSSCRPCDARRQHARYQRPEVRAKVLARGPGNATAPSVEQRRALYQRHRDRAVQVYGGRCAWCGATTDLEFDHVNNDGAAHRAVIQVQEWYRKISLTGVPDPDWLIQLLCVPCHRGPGWMARRASALPA